MAKVCNNSDSDLKSYGLALVLGVEVEEEMGVRGSGTAEASFDSNVEKNYRSTFSEVPTYL